MISDPRRAPNGALEAVIRVTQCILYPSLHKFLKEDQSVLYYRIHLLAVFQPDYRTNAQTLSLRSLDPGPLLDHKTRLRRAVPMMTSVDHDLI